MNKIEQYFPPIYEGIKEFDALALAENDLLDTLQAEEKTARDNQYILTANNYGISEFEKILNIIPNPSIETLQFRRERIVNRLSLTPPFTFRFLEQKLDEIIGAGAWIASVDYSTYTLTIESSAEDQVWFHEILVTINRLKPVNIVFVNKPLIGEQIKASQTIELSKIDFNYALGTTWVLGQKPFRTLDYMGVIQMGNISSLNPELLNDIAGYTAGNVAKIRINDTLVITTFTTKGSVGDTAYIEYDVLPESGVLEITKIELLDSSDNVLSTSSVYVPVLDAIILKHQILIKEGI